MELIASDSSSATVKFSNDEFVSIAKIFSAIYQEYESLDAQIIEISEEQIKKLKDDAHTLLQRMIDNTNRELQSK